MVSYEILYYATLTFYYIILGDEAALQREAAGERVCRVCGGGLPRAGHIHTCTCIHIHIYIYICVIIYIYIYTHTHTHTHVHILAGQGPRLHGRQPAVQARAGLVGPSLRPQRVARPRPGERGFA